jgi:glycosyltransferase involved in cell wall biosynthesis
MMARGKFIAKMDADDMSFPERIERQLKYLLDNPTVDVVGCGHYRVDKNMKLITVYVPPERHEDIIKFVSIGWKFIFGPSFPITDGCLMVKKEWFERWKYNPDIPYAQDFDLNLRSHYSSVFANISDPLYVYRRVGVTSSWLNQTKAVYYKFISLIRYGFKKSSLGLSFLAIVSLIMRPFFAFLTTLYVLYIQKKNVSNKMHRKSRLDDDEKKIELLFEALNKVRIPTIR